jgi:hypothetical protein
MITRSSMLSSACPRTSKGTLAFAGFPTVMLFLNDIHFQKLNINLISQSMHLAFGEAFRMPRSNFLSGFAVEVGPLKRCTNFV